MPGVERLWLPAGTLLRGTGRVNHFSVLLLEDLELFRETRRFVTTTVTIKVLYTNNNIEQTSLKVLGFSFETFPNFWTVQHLPTGDDHG